MRKILISLSIIAAVAAVVVGVTAALLSDTETSTGNTFTVGELDLKVDNTCHYWQNGVPVSCPTDPNNLGMKTTWTEDNLVEGIHKFFWFDDVKPGDYGEDTVSVHVYDNDAWFRLVVTRTNDAENGCNEPEKVAEPNCDEAGNVDGELDENLLFTVWLDEGATEGFQGKQTDPTEGDNIWQADEPILISEGTIDEKGETWAYPIPLVASTTYYFGIAWRLPSTVGNNIQSDSFGGTMTLEVEQSRNNPIPWDGI